MTAGGHHNNVTFYEIPRLSGGTVSSAIILPWDLRFPCAHSYTHLCVAELKSRDGSVLRRTWDILGPCGLSHSLQVLTVSLSWTPGLIVTPGDVRQHGSLSTQAGWSLLRKADPVPLWLPGKDHFLAMCWEVGKEATGCVSTSCGCVTLQREMERRS